MIRVRTACAAVLLFTFLPAFAQQALAQPPAETGSRLDAPDFGVRTQRATRSEDQTFVPHVAVGYSYYVLSDGYGGGDVHAGTFGGFIPLESLRLGGRAEFGARDYSLGGTDIVLSATGSIGYQHLAAGWRFVPFVAVVGTIGGVFSNRFDTPLADALYGAGLEIGVDAVISAPLFGEVAFSYQRVSNGGLSDNLFIAHLGVGL